MSDAVSLAIEVIGWVGAALILAAYILVSAGRIGGQSATFQWLNLIGAVAFIINGSAHRAWPSAVLNIVWAMIAVVMLWRIIRTA